MEENEAVRCVRPGFTYAYDGAGRPQSVTGGTLTYASVSLYAPQGAVNQMTLHNGLQEQDCYNARLQMAGLRVGTAGPNSTCLYQSGDLLALGFGYAATNNNGNLQSQSIAAPGGAGYQQFTYDGVNRLLVADERTNQSFTPACPDSGNVWCQQYGYDGFGNRTITTHSMVLGAWNVSSISSSNNRILNSGWAYDTAGNLTGDPTSDTIAYDGENHQVAFCAVGSGTCVDTPASGRTVYRYDGEGRRVERIDSDGVTQTRFVYDASGSLAAEYTTAAAPLTSKTEYLTVDNLGSTRLVTDSQQTPERHDYLPFGEELQAGEGGWRVGAPGYFTTSNVPLKFTGKERDTETGLDYFGARYFSGAQGRFTSPDEPLGDQYPEDPQSWNLYSYVRNNPLRNTDPTGRDCVTTSNQTATSVSVSVAAGGTEKGCTQSGGAWVAGTVDMKSLTFNGSSIGYSYNPYDSNSLTGAGTIPLGNGPVDALSPSAQEFYNQMSARRESSNHIIAEFGIAQATFAGLYAGTYAGPAVAAWLASGGAAASIRFGQTANQVYHAFRHVQEAGVEIQAAKDAITNDILSKGALPPGLTTGTVNVAGKLLTYNAYKLADGTINVGRVTVK